MKLLRTIKRSVTPFDVGIGALIAAVGIVFFLFFYRRAEYIDIRIKVTDQDVLYQQSEPATWYAHRFFVGDKELDALGRTIAEITRVTTIPLDSRHQAVYVDLKVRALYDSRTKQYSTHGQSLMFGAPMRFYLSGVAFDGFVSEFPGSKEMRKGSERRARVTVLIRNLEPAVAAAVSPGNTVTDADGGILARVTDVAVMAAERVTNTYAGDLLLRYDPIYKDVMMAVDVRAVAIGNDLFVFDNMPLKIGLPFPLLLDSIGIDKYANSISNTPFVTDITLEKP